MKLLDQIFKFRSEPPHPVLRPDPVFIIGMHRSGTSAMGGALEPLGLTVGKSVMPANSERGNPKGYYENFALTDLHDKFMTAIESKWFDERPVRQGQFSSLAARRFRKELIPLLVEEFGAGRPLIKDPRMCRLMPLWLPVIKQHFPQAWFILHIRHPVEAAYSLVKRDQFSMDLGLKMWVVHVLEGERTTRGFNRLFTTYDQLMQSPEQTVLRLAKRLNLSAEAVSGAVSAQIDPALRHHTELAWPAGEPHQDLTLAIHRTLLSDKPGKEEELDRLRSEYYRLVDWKC